MNSATSEQRSAVTSQGSKAGLHGHGQQCVVAPTDPAGAVWAGKQRIDLVFGQKADEGPVEAFGGDGQHALDERGVLWVAQGSEAEQ